jgi:4-amino-4-deoxy-L-arabinose transferase-like glycosyltransferase
VFLAARAWVGPTAAHLATIACALDPSLIAHGSLATVDVAFALFHFLALAAAYSVASKPSAGRGLILGLALGLAFATKFSAVLLIPGIVLAFLAVRAEAVDAHPWRRATLALLVAAVTTTVTIGAAYLFAGVGTPMADIRWDSAPFAFLAGRWPGLRLPLPADFLTGIDLSLARERALKWRVVMLGRQYPRGVWYYFALLWLMKTPLLLLAAEVAGYVRAIRTGLLWRSPPLRFLALNLALLLAYFSLLFHAQIGYRFVLMCVPLGYIIAAAGLATLPASRRWRVIGAIVFLGALGENAAYLGNPLSFTNVAVQPKRDVFRWITHSNVDWRQNEDRADTYLARAGIGRDRLDPPHVLPGRNLLRHYHAAGNLPVRALPVGQGERRAGDPFRPYVPALRPLPADFDRYLDAERRLAPSPRADELCGAGNRGGRWAPPSLSRCPTSPAACRPGCSA